MIILYTTDFCMYCKTLEVKLVFPWNYRMNYNVKKIQKQENKSINFLFLLFEETDAARLIFQFRKSTNLNFIYSL